MARPRTHALAVEPRTRQRAPLDSSSQWRAEDERLARAEESLARLIELESLIRAQRDAIAESNVDQRDHAERVLHELQDRADAEMLHLNALRFPRSAADDATSTTGRARSRTSWSRWTAREQGPVTFVLSLYAAVGVAPRATPVQRRRRRLKSRR